MEEKNMGTYEFEMKEYDYTKSKNEREAGNLARADAVAELLPFLKARFGDEQAEMIAKDTIGFRNLTTSNNAVNTNIPRSAVYCIIISGINM